MTQETTSQSVLHFCLYSFLHNFLPPTPSVLFLLRLVFFVLSSTQLDDTVWKPIRLVQDSLQIFRIKIHDQFCTWWRKQQPINLRIRNRPDSFLPEFPRLCGAPRWPNALIQSIFQHHVSVISLFFVPSFTLELRHLPITSLMSWCSWQGFPSDGSAAQRTGNNKNHNSEKGNY
jgi:hypothetical protein